jgi:hypothetical protein
LYSFGPKLSLPNNHYSHHVSDTVFSDHHKHIEDALKEEALAAEAALMLTQSGLELGKRNESESTHSRDASRGVRFVMKQMVNPVKKGEINQQSIDFFPNGTFEYNSVVYHTTRTRNGEPLLIRYRKFQGDFAGNQDGTLTLSNIRKEFGEASPVARVKRTWKKTISLPISGAIAGFRVLKGGLKLPEGAGIKMTLIPAVKRPLFNSFLGARDVRLNAVQAGYEWYAIVSKDAEKCVLSMPGKPTEPKTVTLSRHAHIINKKTGVKDASWLVALCSLSK